MDCSFAVGPRLRLTSSVRRSSPLLCCVVAALAPAQTPGAGAAPGQDPDRAAALARAVAELPSGSTQGVAGPGAPAVRLTDISLVLDAAAGGSTATDDELALLQGGGHDPDQRGFRLQQAELGIAGVVDGSLRAEARIVTALEAGTGESLVELEEAFLTTVALPAGLQVKAGHFLTRFGRVNPQHPHAWDWLDQPIEHTRVFGGDGMRAPGAQVSWLAPTDRYVEVFLALQNATGETMRSFRANDEVYADEPVGGRLFADRGTRSAADLVATLRAETSLAADRSELLLGASCAFGPNATGGDSVLYGADFVWRWRPADAERGWPFVKLEGELLGRSFAAEAQVDDSVPGTPVALPAATLRDQGGYLQGLWGFAPRWAIGVRGEYATGGGDSYDLATQTFARAGDPLRADRVRIAPLLAFHPSEFARMRLQYDYDDGDALDGPRHTVWIGCEVLIGAHPPHAY